MKLYIIYLYVLVALSFSWR